MRRLLFLLSCCVAVAPSFRAAEASQEEPLPVTKEPYHKTIFENDALRIIDVQIPVGHTCKYHAHVIPSAVIYLTKSTNKSQPWGETDPKKFLDRTLNPGESRYAPYDTQPLTHRVTNTGTGLFRVFDIELLRPKPATAPAFAKLPPQTTQQWEDKLARMSKVALTPGAKSEVPADGHARLLVGITGSFEAASDPSNAKLMKWADYRFFAAQTPIHLVNPGTESAEALLLELN